MISSYVVLLAAILSAEPSRASKSLLEIPCDARTAQRIQQEWANSIANGSPLLTNSIGMKLALIPPGRFNMNQEAIYWGLAETTETPPKLVTIEKPFYFGIYEVTQRQYWQVMKRTPSYFFRDGNGANEVKELDTADHPVEDVELYYAAQFCYLLSALPEERASRRLYKLPTEAQWEYACRAGSSEKYFFGDDNSKLTEFAWFKENSDNRTHHVGQKKQNSFGLYDVLGNVSEWCEGEVGFGWAPGSYLIRGGNWHERKESVRCGFRDVSGGSSQTGFRVLCINADFEPMRHFDYHWQDCAGTVTAVTTNPMLYQVTFTKNIDELNIQFIEFYQEGKNTGLLGIKRPAGSLHIKTKGGTIAVCHSNDETHPQIGDIVKASFKVPARKLLDVDE